MSARLEDIRYSRYEGERRPAVQSIVSLARWSALSAMGARKSWRAKFLPVTLTLIAFIPAVAVLAIRAIAGPRLQQNLPNQGLDGLIPYRGYLTEVGIVVLLFAGIHTPELLCPDRRDNVLSLYLSTAVTRMSYVLGKVLAALVPLLCLTLLPVLLLFLGNTIFATDALTYLGDHWRDLPRLTAAGVLLALYYSLFGLAVASLTSRRAFALGAFAALLLISTAVSGALTFGLELGDHWQLFGLIRDPLFAVRGLYPDASGLGDHQLPVWQYWAASGVVMVLSAAILVRRYSREQP